MVVFGVRTAGDARGWVDFEGLLARSDATYFGFPEKTERDLGKEARC
jgi:hypothetical protein